MRGHGLTAWKTIVVAAYVCIHMCALADAQVLPGKFSIATLIRGDCEFRETVDAAWSPAGRFAAIFDGSEMRTASDGTAMVVFNASMSRVILDTRAHAGFGVVSGRPDRKPEKESVNLRDGRIFLQVRKGLLMTVETPAGTCAMEGGFVVSFSDSSKMFEVMAVEGLGSFVAAGADSSVTLGKGYGISVKSGAAVNGPVPIDERKAEIDAFLAKIEKMK